MRRNRQADQLARAIDDAWLGKVEIDLALAEEIVAALRNLEVIAHFARELQLGPEDDNRLGAAWDLTEALDRYYGKAHIHRSHP